MTQRMTNKSVVASWHAGKPAKNHRESLHTDGEKLYSYNLQIGDTCSEIGKVLKDYTAKGHHGFRSQTTSCHVNLAKRLADVVV